MYSSIPTLSLKYGQKIAVSCFSFSQRREKLSMEKYKNWTTKASGTEARPDASQNYKMPLNNINCVMLDRLDRDGAIYCTIC